MTARFGEVLTAMVTPFETDGRLDVKGARSLAAHLVDHGSQGLVVCGTTGESPTLSHDEKLTLFENVVEEVGDRAKVIAGTGTYDTEESKELTREACARGVDACLVVTPYYSRPPQAALVEHFRAVADVSSVDVMIYDIPGRTGRRVERSTMVELASHERIVAVKDAVGDPAETARLRANLDASGASDFEIYSGDDIMLLPHLAAGAVGIVSVCSHLVGDRMRELFRAWANDATEARRIYLDLVPLFDVIMGLTTSPIPIKAALAMVGVEVGSLRLPLIEATDEQKATIRTALERAGVL
jgi:4-hydroxy-tetrahydrodipicolinate synthase